jgi:hypothetical protein
VGERHLGLLLGVPLRRTTVALTWHLVPWDKKLDHYRMRPETWRASAGGADFLVSLHPGNGYHAYVEVGESCLLALGEPLEDADTAKKAIEARWREWLLAQVRAME